MEDGGGEKERNEMENDGTVRSSRFFRWHMHDELYANTCTGEKKIERKIYKENRFKNIWGENKGNGCKW